MDSVIPDPPIHLDVLEEKVPAGTTLFHGHRREYRATVFNPGPRPVGRFSFFDSVATATVVPVFYAGLTDEVAVAETLLHDVPLRGGQITWAEQDLRIISAVSCVRELRLGQLHGAGLRRLGVTPRQLTDTEADQYHRTVRWAAAIHAADANLDGLAWMSARWNTSKAVMLFGDRVQSSELLADPLVSRDFRVTSDREWLLALLNTVNVGAMPPANK